MPITQTIALTLPTYAEIWQREHRAIKADHYRDEFRRERPVYSVVVGSIQARAHWRKIAAKSFKKRGAYLDRRETLLEARAWYSIARALARAVAEEAGR